MAKLEKTLKNAILAVFKVVFFMGKDSSLQVRTTFFSFLWVIFKENVLLQCPGSCLRLPFNSEGTFVVIKSHFYGKYPQNNQKLTFFLIKYKFILYSVHLKKLLHLSMGLITKTENNFIIAIYIYGIYIFVQSTQLTSIK